MIPPVGSIQEKVDELMKKGAPVVVTEVNVFDGDGHEGFSPEVGSGLVEP